MQSSTRVMRRRRRKRKFQNVFGSTRGKGTKREAHASPVETEDEEIMVKKEESRQEHMTENEM